MSRSALRVPTCYTRNTRHGKGCPAGGFLEGRTVAPRGTAAWADIARVSDFRTTIFGSWTRAAAMCMAGQRRRRVVRGEARAAQCAESTEQHGRSGRCVATLCRGSAALAQQCLHGARRTDTDSERLRGATRISCVSCAAVAARFPRRAVTCRGSWRTPCGDISPAEAFSHGSRTISPCAAVPVARKARAEPRHRARPTSRVSRTSPASAMSLPKAIRSGGWAKRRAVHVRADVAAAGAAALCPAGGRSLEQEARDTRRNCTAPV
eukprot:356870-Chlamydomonas_euryale.AAC.5